MMQNYIWYMKLNRLCYRLDELKVTEKKTSVSRGMSHAAWRNIFRRIHNWLISSLIQVGKHRKIQESLHHHLKLILGRGRNQEKWKSCGRPSWPWSFQRRWLQRAANQNVDWNYSDKILWTWAAIRSRDEFYMVNCFLNPHVLSSFTPQAPVAHKSEVRLEKLHSLETSKNELIRILCATNAWWLTCTFFSTSISYFHIQGQNILRNQLLKLLPML